MIDFKNTEYLKLRKVKTQEYDVVLSKIMVDGEAVDSIYKGVRDGIVFTNKRVITINIQGITGKKADYASLPYSKIQVFSVETAGTMDLDSEMELWFSGLGKVKFLFTAQTDVTALCKMISEKVL